MTIDNNDYEVGYGKPPRRGQFQKGVSGNLKGRPKGSKNFVTALENELKSRIPVTENGKRRNITKREAIAKQLVNKAVSGDPRAMPVLLGEIRTREAALHGEAEKAAQPILQKDQIVMDGIVERIRQWAPQNIDQEKSAPLDKEGDDHVAN